MPLRIEQYALLTDTSAAALVGTDGSIDWLCLPRFDSPALFAALLGDENNGHWRIAPAGKIHKTERRYRDSTLILETDYTTATGKVRVTDFMPLRDRRADIVRMVEGLEGEVEMAQEFVLRFDYGHMIPWVRRIKDSEGKLGLSAIAGPDAVCLRADDLPHPANHIHRGEFTVRAGETHEFTMTWYPSHRSVPSCYKGGERLRQTEKYWQQWAAKCQYAGPYRDQVVRSLLTLKALTYDPTGAIVAAPTTSLPELLGGERNWDYRYCWLRDASLTLSVLLDTGYKDEARAWRTWLLRAVAGEPEDLQILYGVAGERRIPEWTVDWLPGYEGSTPVRIGNAASEQLQIDVYGELLDALHLAREDGVKEDDFSWPLQLALLEDLEQRWSEPDNGIWEVRGPRRPFTHSRLMAWVAFDRAVQAVERFGLSGPVERWRRVRDEIFDEIMSKGYNEDVGAFTQYYGAATVDATALLIPHVGLLPGDDPRVLSTINAVEKQLRDGPFVWRYGHSHFEGEDHPVDGLPAGEGAFLMCSFWLARAYALAGRLPEAEELFQHLLTLTNDVGLLSEEYDVERDRMIGNFPQAFSHLALVSAAFAIEQARGRG